MNVDWTFLRVVGLTYVGSTALALMLIGEFGPSTWLASVTAAACLSAMHFLSGWGAIEYAFEKSHTTFLKIVLGGMVVRLFGMIGVVLVLIRGFGLEALSLLLSLLGYYIVNLSFEITFLQKKVSIKNQ